jgi:hypothetical protein
VGVAIDGMKSNSAPGPNGFIVVFFKKLWGLISGVLLKMVRDFNNNKLDLKRLNFGVITLVPKLKYANTIKQYRPICLLNVDFKNFPKLMINRVTPITDKVISDSQTAFIKGKIYWKVWWSYMRCSMSSGSQGREGSYSKLTLKKHMTK